MTPGANEVENSPPLQTVAGEPNVKNSYVDCATNVDVQRPRRPSAPPATAPLADPQEP
ncbi:hypothetical protein JY651_34350 [Pyxidicoccus parkwayensis]|uniref:Uncharacterized protein n=1 Tax=Pyxidicoccus parkwayensis TaxID=2813578 RepID=A0ABX7NSB1_9BACT|nr:hypothetical protein [Pyxidicoccus parkwaysis]QSQ20314.1 hypothetical protein JY651_34350 [Pyxidicoccus parkwaysis]